MTHSSSSTLGGSTSTSLRLTLALDRITTNRRIGILGGNTSDLFVDVDGQPLRLVEFLAIHAAARGLTPVLFSLAEGTQVLAPPGFSPATEVTARIPSSRDPGEALDGFTRLLEDHTAPLALLVDHVEHLAPDQPQGGSSQEHARPTEVLYRWAHSPAFLASRSMVCLITRGMPVHRKLVEAAGFESITVEFPDFHTRREFVHILTARHDADPDRYAPIPDPEALAASSGGLRLDDLFRLSREAAAEPAALDVLRVRGRKRQVIRATAGGLVEVFEPSYGFEKVAGLGHLAEWVALLGRVEAYPEGVLFVGVPGVGKSFAIQAVAHDLDLPLVALRTIRSMWVGESERNLETALSLLDALAPCVVWMDEIDQVLGQRSGAPSTDAGTSQRLLGRLLEFMGDRSGQRRLLWIGTSNRPDLLDTAVVDRFPAVWPFFHPSRAQLTPLFEIIAAQRGHEFAADIDLEAVAASRGLSMTTGRIIVDLLDEAALRAAADSGRGAPITTRHLEAAVRARWASLDLVEHEYLALLALGMAPSTSRLPWAIGPDQGNSDQIPDYLKPLVDSEGAPHPVRVAARLAELEQQRTWKRWRR
jgi:hypothetical protein